MPRVSLTRALVNLHGAGRADTYDAALLDVAQDHLLWLLAELHLFDGDDLIFKGGTSLRKCRLGSAGRFSTDLDFACPSEEIVLAVCEAIDGAAISGFEFLLDSTRGDGRHWTLTVQHPDLGRPNIGASVEFARRPLVLAPDILPFVELPVHRGYELPLPPLPVIAEAEACAEKLARYRRTALGRDVYDLARLAVRPFVRSTSAWCGDCGCSRSGEMSSTTAAGTDLSTPPTSSLKGVSRTSLRSPSASSRSRSTWWGGNAVSGSDSPSLWTSTMTSGAGRRAIPATVERLRPPWVPAVSPRTDQDELVAGNRRLTPPPVLRPRRTARSWLWSSVRDLMMRCASTSY